MRRRKLQALVHSLEELPPEAWSVLRAARPDAPPPRRWSASRWLRPAIAVAAAAATFAIGLLLGGLLERSRGPTGTTVALRPLGGALATASAAAKVTSDGRLVITFSRLGRPDHSHYYEAWLMSSASELVALGAFQTDRHGAPAGSRHVPVPIHAFRYIDVSLQRVGAGPVHSSDSVLRAPTAPL